MAKQESRLTVDAKKKKIKNAAKKRKRNVNTGNNVKYIYKGKGSEKKTRPLTISQMKKNIESLGYTIPSKITRKDNLKTFHDDVLTLDKVYINIDPLEIPDEGDGRNTF